MEITLEDFLLKQEQLLEDNRLSLDKIAVLKLAIKFADKVCVDEKKIWRLYFDNGTYKGNYVIQIRQNNLTPLALVNGINEIKWPGLQTIVEQCNTEIMKVLENN